MSDIIQIIVTSVSPTDYPFIYSTWLKGQYYDVKESLRPDQKEYWDRQAAEITKLLKNSEATIHVARDSGDALWIAGYSISLGSTLHWIYVRKDYRRRGIANLLLAGSPITHVANLTTIGAEISDKKGFIFEPQGVSHGRRNQETQDPQGTL